MHSARALTRSIYDHFLPRAKHAALTGINGSLAGINVEVPACFNTPKKRANVKAEPKRKSKGQRQSKAFKRRSRAAERHGNEGQSGLVVSGSPAGCFSRERVAVQRHSVAADDHPWSFFGERISETLQGGLSDVLCDVRQPCRYAQTARAEPLNLPHPSRVVLTFRTSLRTSYEETHIRLVETKGCTQTRTEGEMRAYTAHAAGRIGRSGRRGRGWLHVTACSLARWKRVPMVTAPLPCRRQEEYLLSASFRSYLGERAEISWKNVRPFSPNVLARAKPTWSQLS